MLRAFNPLLLCFALFSYGNGLFAQQVFKIQIVSDNQEFLPTDMIKTASFTTYEERFVWLESFRSEMLNRGHLAFSVDSIIESGNQWNIHTHVGQRFEWARLNPGNLDGATLGSVKFRDKIFFEKNMNPNQVYKLFESILEYNENNGYPFATVRLDSAEIDSNRIKAKIHVEKNQLVEIDSVVVRGSSKTHPVYFQNYLNIKPGMPYSEERISNADSRLKELAFVQPFRNTEVLFARDETKVTFFLNDRKASRFDGILGLQPNETTGEIGITGDVKLGLQNAFKRGETIMLNWRRLQNATQDIDVKFQYPYLFNTSFGADLGFSLYRRDTSFVQIRGNIGVSYLLTGTDYIKVFVEPRQSNVISKSFVPNDGLANSGITLFGLEMESTRLDYRFNPTQGYYIFLKGSAGNRTIRKNPELPEQLYEDIALQSTQWNGIARGRLFVPITPRNTVLAEFNGAIIQSPTMFFNELYRIGGMTTIRGFDEESIFASAYTIFTIEYRFLLEQNSNVFAFFDGAWYESDSRQGYIRDTPFGFGLGVSFETGAGIFSLTYALGRQMGNPVLLRAGKIHFGFTSFF